MDLHCISLTHHGVPLEIREQLHYTTTTLKTALSRFHCGPDRPTEFVELIILSTCNRTELYAVLTDAHSKRNGAYDHLVGFLSETRGVPAEAFASYIQHFKGREVIRHLGEVASGLDSMILGEPQILGQVAEAHSTALGFESAGMILSRLFQVAIGIGRRARTETSINRMPASVPSMAVKHARSHFDGLDACRVLVIGAGEAGVLTLQALYKQGIRNIAIANRTLQRAVEVATEYHADALTFEQLPDELGRADVVISSTGAPHTILDVNQVRGAVSNRNGRPLVILDIAVPRDVDPAADELPGVFLYDLDGLKGKVDDTLMVRKQEIPRVLAIVEEEADRYMDWLRHVEVMPVLKEIRQKAESIRRQEVSRLCKQMPDLDDETLEHVHKFSRALVNKLFHHPMVELRSAAGSDHGAAYAEMMRHLFRLPLEDERKETNGTSD